MFLVLRKSRLSVLAVASIAGLVVFRFVLDSSVRNMPPPVPAATGIPAGPVRVKAVEPGFAENKDMQPAAASAAIATVCGDHPPAVLDYCIQHLGAMQGGITDDALRRRIRALFVQAAGRKSQPYAEALPLLLETLSAPRRDVVTDIVCLGSLGLLGDAGDLPLLRRFATMGPRYATAADADGNMTADGSGWHYAWNGENRMVCASNDDVLVTYEYDHRGRMVRKEISSRDTETQSFAYVWDDWNILRETLTTKVCSSVSDNIWGLDINGAFQGAGGIGGLLAVIHENN